MRFGTFQLICLLIVQGPPTAGGMKNVATMKRKKGGKGKSKDGEGTAGGILVMPFLSQFPLPPDGVQPTSELAVKYVTIYPRA